MTGTVSVQLLVWIVGGMAGAIMGMAAFIVWQYRETVAYKDREIADLKARDDRTLGGLVTQASTTLSILGTAVDVLKEIRTTIVLTSGAPRLPPAAEREDPHGRQ